ncbi:MAG: pyridoxal phosphate-dependent aminotransferase [Chitinophagales bacterium]|nr:pyridoxal phosphate-dependent aminotransferase [Bacteroidota bacterium]MCB9044447.1 pyridoxal phosphate-dependent aminotransferase [Chitinophagales bacterium]
MSILSHRIENLQESATIMMAKLSRELKAKGIKVIDLSLGEPDFDTPLHIQEAAKKAIDEHYFKYMPVSGYLDLRQYISEKFQRDNHLHYAPEQIVVSTGAKQSLVNVILSLVNPGDEVIIPAPYWVSYAAMVQLAEGVIVEIPTTIAQDFKISPQQLEAAITPRSKVLLYSSPCNPTGSVYSEQELHALAKVLAKHPQIIVVSDEIYEYINFTDKHASMAAFEEVKDRVVTVNGLSKGFAMTGWRLGYMGAPLAIAKACDKMQGQFTSGTCSISQRAAIAALTGTMEPTYAMRDAFERRRDLVLEQLGTIEGMILNKPEGAFYVFPDVRAFIGKSYEGTIIENVDDLCMFLLNDAHVSLVSGAAFGDSSCVRLSYAASENDLREATKRIKQYLEMLR